MKMDLTNFYLCCALAAVLIIVGVVMTQVGKRSKDNGKSLLALNIIGWFLIVAALVGAVIAFILFINESSGIFGTWLFVIISPIFILVGFILCISIGILSVTEGYKKDKDGQRNIPKITRGWALFILSIVLIVAIIITLAVLFTNYSNSRGDTPVRMM